MEVLNKFINSMILCCCFLFVILISIYIFSPLLYNSETKGEKLQDFSEYKYILYSLRRYLDYYNEENIEALKSCTALLKRQNNFEYKDVINAKIKNSNNTFVIKDIQKGGNNIYIVEYYYGINFIEEEFYDYDTNKIVLKLNKINKTFSVYYDSLVDLEKGDANEK